MITVRNDVILPYSIVEAAGVHGKVMRVNQRTNAPNGQRAVNIQQDRSRRQYEFGTVPVKYDILQRIQACFEVTDAGAYGFLMEDPTDITVDAASGFLYPYTTGLVGSIGLGYGVPSLRMYKRYTSIGSTRTKDRRVSRPQATPTVTRAGSPVTLGASPGNAAVDYDTGLVTFVADASQAITSITPGATTTITFANNTGMYAAMAVAQRMYLGGISGTAASTLNGASHSVASKSGNSVVVSTNTTGLTATGGTAYKYPQASEAMTWNGRLYVPVQFASDELDWSLVAGGYEGSRLYIGQSVLLDELLE